MTMDFARLHRPRVAPFFRALFAGSLLVLAGCATDRPAAEKVAAPAARIEAAALRALFDGAYRLGSTDAAIVVIEFTDFQCPYCRRFHEGVFRELRQRYVDAGVVQYVVRDFPLRSHRHAFPAATAAHCAAAQGRYWEMSDRLFANQARLDAALYPVLAREAGLAAAEFEECMKSPAARRAVNHSLTVGMRLGIGGTPTLLLGRMDNGALEIVRTAAGVPDFELLEMEIEMLRR